MNVDELTMEASRKLAREAKAFGFGDFQYLDNSYIIEGNKGWLRNKDKIIVVLAKFTHSYLVTPMYKVDGFALTIPEVKFTSDIVFTDDYDYACSAMHELVDNIEKITAKD